MVFIAILYKWLYCTIFKRDFNTTRLKYFKNAIKTEINLTCTSWSYRGYTWNALIHSSRTRVTRRGPWETFLQSYTCFHFHNIYICIHTLRFISWKRCIFHFSHGNVWVFICSATKRSIQDIVRNSIRIVIIALQINWFILCLYLDDQKKPLMGIKYRKISLLANHRIVFQTAAFD